MGELGEIITGSTPSTQVQAYYSDDGIPWVTPTDISENITFNTAKRLSEEGQKVARVVPQNTVLVTSIASIGKNTMLGTTGSFNQQINGLVPNEKENFPYFLLSESALWSEKMKSSAAAGTMQIINKTEFSELKTFVPSLKEQTKIGTFFRNLDNLIALHQRKLLDSLKNAAFVLNTTCSAKNNQAAIRYRFIGIASLIFPGYFASVAGKYHCTQTCYHYIGSIPIFTELDSCNLPKQIFVYMPQGFSV